MYIKNEDQIIYRNIRKKISLTQRTPKCVTDFSSAFLGSPLFGYN